MKTPTKKQLLEIAKRNPHLLTSALREAGNFCYLIMAEDIQEYINEREVKDLADVDNDEVRETLRWRNSKMGDIIPYGELCSDVVDSLRIERSKQKDGKSK
jgi:hypothetical protein